VEAINLPQSFGVTSDGRVVSVEDVRRGKACDCCCPECDESLIARQGEVRAWHFAHASGTGCTGAAEGALHRAAKQLLVETGSVLVPALEGRASHRLPDGRLGEATVVKPPERWTLTQLREEVAVGVYRIDVVGTHEGRPVLIEVAVTHFVDPEKRKALSELEAPCFEISLDMDRHEAWSWEDLHEEVLERPENRQWIVHPEQSMLDEHARCEAVAKAFDQPVPASGLAERIRLRLFGVPVQLVDRGWGLCLWWPYNERVNAMLKAIAKSFGGRYNGAPYRNWVIPAGARSAVLEQLEGIGAIRET